MGCSTSKVQAQKDDDDYVEGIVCKDTDIKENEMKSFDLEDAGRVLLVRQNGKLTAIGSKCTHNMAPLVYGALGDGRVRCQWHGACYNVTTGDIEDFPGLDALPCFQVKVENGDVKVRAKREEVKTSKRTKPMVAMDENETNHMVVIGGGPAGATCVEALRQEGFRGKITMVARENALPYDRVKVSKSIDFDIKKAQLRNDEFYRKHNITVLKGTEATKVETDKNIVHLSTGKTLNYTKLFIATGLKPYKLDVPGKDFKEVVVLRDFSDSQETNKLINENCNVVILGASFVALEAADYCIDKVKSVTVIIRDTTPFKALLGEAIGDAVKALLESNGIKFYTKSGIKTCLGNSQGVLEQVELLNGEKLPANLCVMGVGSTCYTDFLKDSGIEIRSDGSIEANEYLQTNVPNVFVGGDIAHAPVYTGGQEKATVSHYPLAHYHGKMAAVNMLDKKVAIKAVPYFWTMLSKKGIRYAGHGDYDDIVFDGKPEDLKFVAYYLKGDHVVGVSSCGRDPVVSQYAEYRAQGKKLYRKDLGDDFLAWTRN